MKLKKKKEWEGGGDKEDTWHEKDEAMKVIGGHKGLLWTLYAYVF